MTAMTNAPPLPDDAHDTYKALYIKWTLDKAGFDMAELWDAIWEKETEATTLRAQLSEARMENERLSRDLDDANYWRKRHSDLAEEAGKRSNENWQKWKDATARADANERALRLAAGLASTLPQFSDKHPQEVLEFIKADAASGAPR